MNGAIYSLACRCTHYNQDLCARGAKLLLQLLVQHFDNHHAAHPGGFLGTSPVKSRIDRELQATELAPPSRAAAETATARATGTTTAAGVGAGADPSPRKARRKRAVSAALYRGEYYRPVLVQPVLVFCWYLCLNGLLLLLRLFLPARVKEMAIQMNWTASVPTFYQESDTAL